eukprot:scaffold60763_cov33-Tisochrysis_lutea.AAC.3
MERAPPPPLPPTPPSWMICSWTSRCRRSDPDRTTRPVRCTPEPQRAALRPPREQRMIKEAMLTEPCCSTATGTTKRAPPAPGALP